MTIVARPSVQCEAYYQLETLYPITLIMALLINGAWHGVVYNDSLFFILICIIQISLGLRLLFDSLKGNTAKFKTGLLLSSILWALTSSFCIIVNGNLLSAYGYLFTVISGFYWYKLHYYRG